MPSYRSALIADVDDVLAFWQVAAEDAHRPPDSGRALRGLIERDPEALRLAEDAGRLVGTLIAGYDGWRCHLYRLAVHPDWRRQGIAGDLLSWAERRLSALGATRIDAMILDDNSLAHHTWSAAGFARQAEWSRWVKPLNTA